MHSNHGIVAVLVYHLDGRTTLTLAGDNFIVKIKDYASMSAIAMLYAVKWTFVLIEKVSILHHKLRFRIEDLERIS